MAWKIRGYLKETRNPVYSAALVFPFFCIYHVGTIILNTTYINGADALIIRLLNAFSVHSVFASALVLMASFSVWQLRTRASWKIDPKKLLLLLSESVCFALLLLFAFSWFVENLDLVAAGQERRGIANLVLYCGAGIYEELVFRGFLLGLLILGFSSGLRMKKATALTAAILLGSLLFSAFHYVGSGGDVFSFGSFFQRTAGGLYFSILFVKRGFGVAAATHSLYDILAGFA